MSETTLDDGDISATQAVATVPESSGRGAGADINRERRLRRRARRLGFIVNKRRGFSTYYGPNYWLLDDDRGNPVLHDNGNPRNRVTLEDVEAHLDRAEQMERNFDWDKAVFGR